MGAPAKLSLLTFGLARLSASVSTMMSLRFESWRQSEFIVVYLSSWSHSGDSQYVDRNSAMLNARCHSGLEGRVHSRFKAFLLLMSLRSSRIVLSQLQIPQPFRTANRPNIRKRSDLSTQPSSESPHS
jgi:hypothetical protein